MLRGLLTLGVLLAGCYAPDLADCAVVCQDTSDCAGDQSCVAGMCTSGAACVADSGNGNMSDGSAARMITLKATIMGEGKLVVDNVGECLDTAPGHTCTWTFPAGTRGITAYETKMGHTFERWTSLTCAGQDSTCSAVLQVNATVSVKFR